MASVPHLILEAADGPAASKISLFSGSRFSWADSGGTVRNKVTHKAKVIFLKGFIISPLPPNFQSKNPNGT